MFLPFFNKAVALYELHTVLNYWKQQLCWKKAKNICS